MYGVYEHTAAGLSLRETNSVGPGLGSNKHLHLFSKAPPSDCKAQSGIRYLSPSWPENGHLNLELALREG